MGRSNGPLLGDYRLLVIVRVVVTMQPLGRADDVGHVVPCGVADGGACVHAAENDPIGGAVGRPRMPPDDLSVPIKYSVRIIPSAIQMDMPPIG